MAVLHQPSSNRFAAAVAGSLLVNLILWGTMAAGASRVAPIPPTPSIEVSRVVIDPKTKVVKPAVVKPAPKPIVKIPEHRETPKPASHEQPKPPPVVRNKVITAAPTKSGPPDDNKGFVAPPDGNGAVGKPTTGQGQGENKPHPEPPKDPVKTPDPPVKQPDPIKQPDPVKQPDPPPVKQPDPPKPKGPTKDAEPMSQVSPEIPDDLKSDSLKTFVRVRVEISEDGSFDVVLRTSSGKPEVDRLIVDALKKWKWKPALKDGEPVKSTQAFRFEIEVK